MKSERISPFWVNGYQPFSARVDAATMEAIEKWAADELHIPEHTRSLSSSL